MSFSSKPSSRLFRQIVATSFGLLLVACDGGGSGGGSSDGTVSYTVTATAGSGGSISPSGDSSIAYGTTASYTVTPDTGYVLSIVSGCGGTLAGNTYTTGAISGDCTVSATFTALPVVSFADASVLEGNSGTATLAFTVSLSAQANGDVTVDYATSDGTAKAGSDYTATSGTLTINSGTTSNTVSITVNGDTTPESDETLTLTLSNASSNAMLGTSAATGTITNDDVIGTLNDTGITLCGDYAYGTGSGTHNNDVDCVTAGATQTADGTETANGLDPVPAGQDALYGRDVTANDDSDGHAGFSFTKIDSSGNALPASATSWDCVLDNVTGLMWEVKTTDSGLHDKNWTYTWYNSDSATNGGSVGTANGGSCFDSTNCDTEKYVAQVNASGICGYTDWRMPTAEELPMLVDSSIAYPGTTIGTAWFPNTMGSYYWSSSPSAIASYNAWFVNFNYGHVDYDIKSSTFYVRLVRGG